MAEESFVPAIQRMTAPTFIIAQAHNSSFRKDVDMSWQCLAVGQPVSQQSIWTDSPPILSEGHHLSVLKLRGFECHWLKTRQKEQRNYEVGNFNRCKEVSKGKIFLPHTSGFTH